jgi:hypothetical protein
MRRLVALGSVITLMGTLCWADTPPPPPNPAPNGGAEHPCKAIEQACSSAGFVKGEAAQGKGLFKDCMQPILQGQAVNGVSVNPTEVSACKERMAHRHGHRQGGQGGQGSPGGQGGPSGGNPSGGQGSGSGPESKGDSGDDSGQ